MTYREWRATQKTGMRPSEMVSPEDIWDASRSAALERIEKLENALNRALESEEHADICVRWASPYKEPGLCNCWRLLAHEALKTATRGGVE